MRLNPFKPKRPFVGRTWPALALSPGQFAVALCAVFSLIVAGILALADVGNTKTSFETGALRPAISMQSASAPAGFLGYKWGDPLRAVRTDPFIKVIGPNHEGVTTYSVKRTDSLLGLPVKEEDYWFSHGRFHEGVACIASSQSLKTAKDALVKAFGPPSFASEQLWRWHWPQASVTAQLNADTNIQVSIWNDAVRPVSFKTQNRQTLKSR
jgi:hypothetical protein